MKFETYVNLAKTKSNIPSNNKLAKAVGLSSSALNLFVKEKSTPSPDTVLKVADLAGCDEKRRLK